MQDNPLAGMWGRYILFIVLSMAILVGNAYLVSLLAPPKQPLQHELAHQEPQRPDVGAVPAAPPSEPTSKPGAAEAQPAAPIKPKAEPKADLGAAPPIGPEPEVPEQHITLGSLDSASAFRMLATLTSRGAAVRRIELNSPRFHDLEDRSGYLGHVPIPESEQSEGYLIRAVGPGTPADRAGLKPGDRILALDAQPITGLLSLTQALAHTKPRQTVSLSIARAGQQIEVPVTLGRRPLEIIRPEDGAPPSFLVTLCQIDDDTLLKPDLAKAKDQPDSADLAEQLERELDGAKLRNVNWEVVSHDQAHVRFRRVLARRELEVYKTFRLAQAAPDQLPASDAKDYHLNLEIEIRNLSQRTRRVVYHVDGPNGLPTEGWWYASKVGHGWGAAGLRDVVASFSGKLKALSAVALSRATPEVYPAVTPMDYVGIDAQYFAVVLIPQRSKPGELWFSQWQPIRYGQVDPDLPSLANTSFRVTSAQHELPAGGNIQESFVVFAGPRRPALLAQYGLDEIITYGWYGPIARLLLAILHGFYQVIPNYGVAIVLLTVLVRLCMFPLSKKQALSAQKMQQLQPEIKRIQEKYKNNLEARGRAQQELFRKHGVNPMGGCLIVLLQLPVFVGLYRALMVDVELRQAPLITESIRWASNLAAPDMLIDWSGWMPEFVNRGVGIFGLGPYFNLLPVLTIVLFLWQQKKFMPPPADEQQAMQQRIMQFMMIFMGVLFFKVASGLCVYFIASSLWSVAERKFLPKATGAASASSAAPVAARAVSGGDGSPAVKRKARGKRR